ncbi:hypothetical protein Tco_1315519 [Tanacetum coccineum]
METIHVTFDEMAQTMAPVRISSGPVPVIMTSGQLKSGLAPTDKELEMLFQPMFDEHIEQSPVDEQVPSATEVNAQVAPPGSAQSSSGNDKAVDPNHDNYPPDHIRRWTKDHPLDNIVGNPSRPVSTRKQLASDALVVLSQVVYKVKLDDMVTVLKNKAGLVGKRISAGRKNMIIYQMDVKILAFPERDLQEEVLWRLSQALKVGVNSMAEQIVPAQPPTRNGERRLYQRSQCVKLREKHLPIQCTQKIPEEIPSFQISVDIAHRRITNIFPSVDSSANELPWGHIPATVLEDNNLSPVYGRIMCINLGGQFYPCSNPVPDGKTSGSDKPRHPVHLQMPCGESSSQTNLDHASLIGIVLLKGSRPTSLTKPV